MNDFNPVSTNHAAEKIATLKTRLTGAKSATVRDDAEIRLIRMWLDGWQEISKNLAAPK